MIGKKIVVIIGICQIILLNLVFHYRHYKNEISPIFERNLKKHQYFFLSGATFWKSVSEIVKPNFWEPLYSILGLVIPDFCSFFRTEITQNSHWHYTVESRVIRFLVNIQPKKWAMENSRRHMPCHTYMPSGASIRWNRYASMTTLLTHTVAHST